MDWNNLINIDMEEHQKRMEIHHKFALQERQKDYETKLLQHIIDGSGHDKIIRNNDDNLSSIMDNLIIQIRSYTMINSDSGSLRFLVGYRIKEHIEQQLETTNRFFTILDDTKGRISNYRGIEIIPVEYLEDEIILLSDKAFPHQLQNYFHPFFTVTLEGQVMPIIVNPKLIVVSRDCRAIIEKMTDKELRIEVLDRSNSKYPYGLILEEINKRGIK